MGFQHNDEPGAGGNHPLADHMKRVVNLDVAVVMRSEKLKTYIQIGLGKLNTKPVF